MAARGISVLQPVSFSLEDGTQFTTIFNEANKQHHVFCDLCGAHISLHSSANPYRIVSHRGSAACTKKVLAQTPSQISNSASSQPTQTLAYSGEPITASTAPVPTTPTTPRFNPGPSVPSHRRHVRNESITNITETLAGLTTSPAVLPSLLPLPCPGVGIPWTAGSMWATYPYGLHEPGDVGWEPIHFDSKKNTIYFRSDSCLAPEQGGNGNPCSHCQQLPRTSAFSKLEARAIAAKDHTPWQYLTPSQQRALITKLTKTCKELRTQLSNKSRANARSQRANTDYRRIMMLLSQNEIPGLRRLLIGLLKRGASPQMVLALLERCINGFYRPHQPFNKRELDISFLIKSLGGPKLLYALQKSYGLASVSTVQRKQPIPRLLPSVGVPNKAEISHNISSFFDPEIKPPKSYPGSPTLPGNIIMFDGIAIETKCRYCPRRNVILGLCREHVNRFNTQVDTMESVDAVRTALAETDLKSSTKVCFGSDATVVAIAPYADQEHYTAFPLVVSGSDKTEKSNELASWLNTILETWKEHPQGEKLHGPIWALGSDGDGVYRLAKFQLCMRKKIEADSDLGKILTPLVGLNQFTSIDGVVLTSDMKHIAKRFATLTRNSQGLMINDTIVRPPDIIDHLSQLPNLTREKSAGLLDPADKQNVPKAILLIQELSNVRDLQELLDPTTKQIRKTINFYSVVLDCFILPFITVTMSLSEQVESLSTYSHLVAALYFKHGTACLTTALYADSQAVVKNIIITAARMQLLNPDFKFYILLEGTDRLEVVFSETRTLDHACNFDIEQLGQKLSLGALINAAFQRNPDIDRGHRRLQLDGALGIDHANPKSWTGDVRVGNVNLLECWNAGRANANKTLVQYFGLNASVDFIQIFSDPNRDLLRPNGEYVGTSFSPDDCRSEMENEIFSEPAIPAITYEAAIASDRIVPDTSSRDEDTYLGIDLEDFIPESIEQLEQNETPLAFSTRLVSPDDGKEYMKSSVVATLSSNWSRKATTRTLRVQGVALEDLRQKKMDVDLGFDLMENDDVLRAGDLVAILIRVGSQFCLSIIVVKGFKVGKDRTIKTTVDIAKVDDFNSGIKVLGQIMELEYKSASSCWQWTGKYLQIDTTSEEAYATHKYFMLEFPSVLVNLVGPTLSSSGTTTTYNFAGYELTELLALAWDMLDPESEQIHANIEMLHYITNPCLPYCSLHVSNVPAHLRPKVKLNSSDSIACYICDTTMKLSLMRNHIGRHILLDLHQKEDPKVTHPIGIDPCGFCGRDGCLTQLSVGGKITSDCDYHYAKMNYKSAKNCTRSGPCTNVPIHCPLCPHSTSGNPRTIWKYNARYHIISEHTQNNQAHPGLPAQFVIDTFIRRQEEGWMGITVDETRYYRLQNQIPDSDIIDALTAENTKRERSDTHSTAGSDSHKPKQSRVA
ncbi:hypothetical protein C8R45DRAFT_1131162 [Mycena sanguinolenta]|nr:hypothetical protein C8R45DRAFT_1131162 [Mycena sanguinolenta]